MENINVVVVDTCALMHSLKVVQTIGKDHRLVISATVLEELDKHKDNFKDSERCFRAREALKFINENEDELEFFLDQRIPTQEELEKFDPNGEILKFDMSKNDNKILLAAYMLDKSNTVLKDIYTALQEDPTIADHVDLASLSQLINSYEKEEYSTSVLTYDIGMKVKAKSLGINVIDTFKYERDYKGYRILKGSTEDINNAYELGMDQFSEDPFLTNEYIIEINTDTDSEKIMKWDGEKICTLRIPQMGKEIRPKNLLQKAALDLLFNKNIPIKVICGTFGSGKTFLAVKASNILLNEGTFNKMLLVRNPVPADNIDIGALPGDKEDKVGSYFKPMLQYLDDDIDIFDPENEKRGRAVECEIVSFMKGISIDNTVMIVDEAEDLNLKLLKMIGTRVGQGSSVIFTGDYKQAESKYRADNGLKIFIEKCKGNPLVGIIMLEEDVRSESSKVFAEL